MIAVGILLASTAACVSSGTSQGEPTARATSIDAPSSPRPLDGLKLPVEDYMPSPWQIHQEHSAWVAVITTCLKRYGIANSTPMPVFRGPRTLLELRYGTSDVTWASRYGYWMPGDDRPVPKAPSVNPDEAKLMTGSVRTYHGKAVPVGGCVQEARDSLSGVKGISAGRYNRLIGETGRMASETFHVARKRSAVVRAEKSWSTCMKEKGYAFPANIFAASDSLQLPSLRTAPAADSGEVEMASADARCVQQSDVIHAWFAAESLLQKEKISESPSSWEEMRRSYRERMVNVGETLKRLKVDLRT
ncbi:hypothetical protein ACPYPG_29165 [Streptomyces sp. FR-108]|uniref:hypothetical protein n=1 Tax=Streptomyces sp. FR-108 TaxID=3416665 RepID=UPI003CF23389